MDFNYLARFTTYKFLELVVFLLLCNFPSIFTKILNSEEKQTPLWTTNHGNENFDLKTQGYLRMPGNDNKNSSIMPECNCGHRKQSENRIVGGNAAELHEFPWRCALYIMNRYKQLQFFCGCSIISKEWAMTAAHCTSFLNKNTKLFVNVGDHDLTTTAETTNQFVEVSNIKQHEKYNRRTIDFDMSLLKLGTPLTFSEKVAPVCLPFKYATKTLDSATITASGWGLQKEGSRDQTAVLRKVDLKVISNQACKRLYRGSTISNNMLCTLSAGKDACQGDSGSSADFFDTATNRSYAVGVVSFGHGCGRRNSPGVFARVTQMLSWIKSNTGEQFCEE